ncbi:DNA gyrase inhibitor YacG [Marinobacter caseinilyticus]|uniref:DNA gyrase inhibitor YacG n=1 Tax=Marinobacter caseinilyticus TaxID=2692195 RepID=UPI00140E19FC|nr:DNA gyrase inhibitor YacG [Marinobacter caseinilyticus]
MIVDCPTCKTPVEWLESNPYRPFCSERCKLIDLGAWANEDYRVPAEDVDPNDLDQGGDTTSH